MARRAQPRTNPPARPGAYPAGSGPAPVPYAAPAASLPPAPGAYAYPPSGYAPAPYPQQPAPRPRIPFGVDVYNGAVRGDFAREIGGAGAVTQIVMGFTPGIGTLCALRDCVADWRKRDRVGLCLNLLALTPLLGGFPKTAQVLRAVHNVGRVVHVAHRRGQADQRPGQVPAPGGRPAHTRRD